MAGAVQGVRKTRKRKGSKQHEKNGLCWPCVGERENKLMGEEELL